MLSRILKVDPSTGIVAVSGWAIILGTSILFPGTLLAHAPSFLMMRHLCSSSVVWGGAMVTDGIVHLLLLSSPSSRLTAAWVALSVSFWFAIGASMIISARTDGPLGFDSPTGQWCIFSAALLVLAAAQLGRRA